MAASKSSKKLVVALAAEELCKEKNFRSLTVPEICAKAGISKTSFYRLFEDKFDISFWVQSLSMSKGVGECGHTLTCEQGATVTLQGQALFRNLCLQTANAGEVIAPDERGRSDTTAMLRKTIAECHSLELDDELNFMIEWFSIASRETAKIWLKDSRGKDAQTVARWMSECCPQRLKRILDNPVDPCGPEPMDLRRLTIMSMASGD